MSAFHGSLRRGSTFVFIALFLALIAITSGLFFAWLRDRSLGVSETQSFVYDSPLYERYASPLGFEFAYPKGAIITERKGVDTGFGGVQMRLPSGGSVSVGGGVALEPMTLEKLIAHEKGLFSRTDIDPGKLLSERLVDLNGTPGYEIISLVTDGPPSAPASEVIKIATIHFIPRDGSATKEGVAYMRAWGAFGQIVYIAHPDSFDQSYLDVLVRSFRETISVAVGDAAAAQNQLEDTERLTAHADFVRRYGDISPSYLPAGVVSDPSSAPYGSRIERGFSCGGDRYRSFQVSKSLPSSFDIQALVAGWRRGGNSVIEVPIGFFTGYYGEHGGSFIGLVWSAGDVAYSINPSGCSLSKTEWLAIARSL